MIGGFNNLHFPLLPAILLYFQTLPNHWWLQLLKFSPVACNLVVFSNIANSLVASITENFPCCLQSCCSLKQCKIPGGVNNLDGPPLPAVLLYFHALHNYWWLAWNLAVLSHGQISGGFNNLYFPLLPAILLNFQTLPTHWWLQLLKFSLVACNIVVVSNNAKYLAASII